MERRPERVFECFFERLRKGSIEAREPLYRARRLCDQGQWRRGGRSHTYAKLPPPSHCSGRSSGNISGG